VFPPIDQSTPAPSGNVQTPYQPTPPPNPYNTPAGTGTPAPSPSYGYPQQGGYQTPAPSGYSPQQGPSTPPPYNITPQAPSGSSGGRNNKPVLIGSAVVAVLAAGGLIAALLMNGGDKEPEGSGGSATASVSKAPGYRGPDTSKTVDKEICTDPDESYNDPDKIRLPNFKFKYIKSVKECFQAAGWPGPKIVNVDENTYGEGSIRDQFPPPGTDVDPEDMPEITLKVSTGNPPS